MTKTETTWSRMWREAIARCKHVHVFDELPLLFDGYVGAEYSPSLTICEDGKQSFVNDTNCDLKLGKGCGAQGLILLASGAYGEGLYLLNTLFVTGDEISYDWFDGTEKFYNAIVAGNYPREVEYKDITDRPRLIYRRWIEHHKFGCYIERSRKNPVTVARIFDLLDEKCIPPHSVIDCKSSIDTAQRLFELYGKCRSVSIENNRFTVIKGGT